MIEALVTIADDPQNALIPADATVQLTGSQGQVDCEVFLRVITSGGGGADRIGLHVRADVEWSVVEGANTLVWYGSEVIETPVLSVARLSS